MSFNPDLCRNESEVESKLIVQYLLPQLGYSPETWHQEIAFGSIRLDFLAFATQVVPFVLDDSSPLSVIFEAKHPRENLDNHVRKLKRYLTSLNVRYALLTNGREIRIYERIAGSVQLRFHCLGQNLESNFDTIKKLIGRNRPENPVNSVDRARPKQTEAPNSLPTVVSPNSEIKNHSIMQTIAIYHHKGGVGKTTVSVNLAAALRKQGKRVLLVDIDAQANTTFATGLIKFQFEEDDDIKERNIFNLLETSTLNFIPDIVRKSSGFSNPEIDVIPSHITMIERQHKLVKSGTSRLRLARKLEKVKDEYDVVIIDTPPSLDLYAQVALTAADYLIIPSDLRPFSNQGLASVQRFIKEEIDENREGLGKNSLEIMGVLPSKIPTNSKYQQYTFPKQRQVIPDRYHLPLMETSISERTPLYTCLNRTIPMGNLDIPDPKSIIDFAEIENNSSAEVAANEFEALALEVLDKMGIK
ncbi:MAG: AAA family ATPase [Cyanobacteriota bacterium]|nr:AAA family ATPase [Cyanobacteriota bacterium]